MINFRITAVFIENEATHAWSNRSARSARGAWGESFSRMPCQNPAARLQHIDYVQKQRHPDSARHEKRAL
jgi:hypothetical protein